jgi:hypothetical protein
VKGGCKHLWQIAGYVKTLTSKQRPRGHSQRFSRVLQHHRLHTDSFRLATRKQHHATIRLPCQHGGIHQETTSRHARRRPLPQPRRLVRHEAQPEATDLPQHRQLFPLATQVLSAPFSNQENISRACYSACYYRYRRTNRPDYKPVP